MKKDRFWICLYKKIVNRYTVYSNYYYIIILLLILNKREYNVSYKSFNDDNLKLMTKIESSKRNNTTIESFGGTGGCVTGSCHRVTINNDKFLVDLGMYQGKFEERSKQGIRRNFQPMKDVANGVKSVLETHVHIDHVGRLPMIFKDGFTPTVLASELTAELMEPVLLNSAEIQENKPPQERLYDKWDVDKTLRHVKGVKPFKMVEIGKNITAEFILNGHIFGGSSIFVRNHSSGKNIFFTGDMGKPYQSLCGGYKEYVDRFPKDPINALMIESTNFERQPISFEEKKRKFLEEIYKTWEGGGNPLFPTLSLHRTPELMELICNCQKSGELPNDFEIIIDAPYAMKLLNKTKDLGPKYLSRRFGDDPSFYKTDESSMARFDLENLTIIESHQTSLLNDKEMARYPGKAIIIASGGMGEFGRSVNYIHGDFGKNPKNVILFNCYQVPGTEGCELTQRENIIRNKKTGARIAKLEGFTSHISGPDETFEFLNRFNLNELETVIITHGKDSSRIAMADEFKRRGYGAKIILSQINQAINC